MIDILSKHEKFNELSSTHQRRLLMLINRVMNGEFRHTSLIPMAEIDSVALSSKYLRKMFRKKGDGSYYKSILDEYFDCVNPTYHFGIGKGRIRKFRLKDWVSDEIIAFYKSSNPLVYSRFHNDFSTPFDSIPVNAVHDTDILGQMKSSNIVLQSELTLNTDNIERMIYDLENAHSTVIRHHKKVRNLIHLYQWRKTLNNTLVPDSVLQLYQESTNGRLSSLSGMNSPNSINTPRLIRKVLFSDMDLYDYDMSNSHISIFYNLCQRYDVECPNLKYYLDNKRECRDVWSEQFNVKTKKLKSYIISWLYGNSNNVIKQNSFYSILGEDRMLAIKKNEFLSGLFKEFVSGRRVIVKNHRKNGLIRNIMGKERKIEKMSSDLCFILFGYESKIMEIVNQIIGDDMKVLIYDGWIGNRVDVSSLEAEVMKELGLSIKFDEELIESPTLFSLK